MDFIASLGVMGYALITTPMLFVWIALYVLLDTK